MKIITAVLLMLLSGCAAKPQIIEVPVSVKAAPPPVIIRPALPITLLGKGASAGVQIGAWAETVDVLQGYAAYLEMLLDGYR